MISAEITKKIGEAMKARDAIRLSTLRMLSSTLNYEKIAKQHDLTSDEELIVVKKEAKKRTDAIEALTGALDKQTSTSPEEIRKRIEKEETELKILKEYLPEEMGEGELNDLVSETIKQMNATGIAEMGKVIGAVKAKAGMRADGSVIAKLVREALGVRQ